MLHTLHVVLDQNRPRTDDGRVEPRGDGPESDTPHQNEGECGSGDQTAAGVAESLLSDASPLVRAMAIWALRMLAPARAEALRPAWLASEAQPDVRREWSA